LHQHDDAGSVHPDGLSKEEDPEDLVVQSVGEQSDLQREVHVIAAMRQAKFLVDTLLVRIDSLGTDEQLLANLGRAVAASNELEHVLLALGKLLEPRTLVGVLRSSLDSLRQRTARGWRHVDIAVGYGSNSGYQLAIRSSLDQVPTCARLHRF